MPILSGTGARRLMRSALLVACLGLATPSIAVDSSGSSSGGSAASVSALLDAQTHIKRKRWNEAVAVLKQIIAIEPGNADALNLMGYSLRKSGDYKRAQGFYLKALKVSPKHLGANEYLGELYVETGQLAKAGQRLEALKGICGTGCEEYRELKQAIDAAS